MALCSKLDPQRVRNIARADDRDRIGGTNAAKYNKQHSDKKRFHVVSPAQSEINPSRLKPLLLRLVAQ
jgi:hypothetical protein